MKRSVAEVHSINPDQPGVSRTIAESTYRRIRQDILWVRFAPGSPLRSDELRARYGVGISPLREALTRLASERLVTSVGQRGFRVAPLTAYDVEDTMATRILIESEALSRSIRRGDMAWETALVAAFHALSRHPDPERTRPGHRKLGAVSSPVSHGVAGGMRLAVAHRARRAFVRSGGTAADFAHQIRSAKNIETRHRARA